MIKNKLSSLGFSIFELTVTLGLAGGLAVLIMNQIETSNKTLKKAEVYQDLNTVISTIQRTMAKTESCTATVASVINDGTSMQIKKVYSKNGVATPQKLYGLKEFERPPSPTQSQMKSKTGFQIVEMKINNTPINSVDPSLKALEITFQAGRMEGGAFKKTAEFKREFRFREIGSGSEAICNGELDNDEILLQQARIIACKSMEGTWLDEEDKCKLTNLPVCIIKDGEDPCDGGAGAQYLDYGKFRVMKPGGEIHDMRRCCREPVDPETGGELLSNVGSGEDDFVDPPCDPEDFKCPQPSESDTPVCKDPPEKPASCAPKPPDPDPMPVPPPAPWVPEVGEYSDWSAWTYCSQAGKQTRYRKCGDYCNCVPNGLATEERSCTRSDSFAESSCGG